MKDTFKRVLDGTRALEARLAGAFDHAAHTVAGREALTPLETVDRAVHDVARHVHPAGRGRLTFPFNRVVVTFAVPAPEAQARFEAICRTPPTLQDRVRLRLVAAGCSSADDVEVAAAYAEPGDPAWAQPDYHVELSRADAPADVPAAAAIRVDLMVASGTAERGAYSFRALPITIGRGAEVRDARQLLVRLNHVAFAESGDEITQSVSRRHARIEQDAASGRVRIVDDNSAQGTSIVRGGRGIPVPRGSRGLGLASGDEIVLGQARLTVRITRD